MARKTTSSRGSTTDPAPKFDEDYLDVDHWPHRWRVEPKDLQPGERMLDVFKPFLLWLLDQGLSRKTLRVHRDNVCALGGEIIRQINFHPELRKRPIKQLLTDVLNADDGPLIYTRCSEAEQLSFDSTCRKLHRFLTGSKSPSR
ncbi:MAG: hypothetical protein ACRETL_04105 [Gammaproteobacteria bacterium]